NKSTGYLITREEDPEYPVLLSFVEEILNIQLNDYPPNRMMNFDIALDNNYGEQMLLEIYTHAPNGLISKLFESYQGIALNDWQLKLQTGYLQKPVIKEKIHQRYSALCIFPKQNGLVTEINKPIFSSSTEVFWRIHPGQRTTESDNIEDYGLAVLLSNNCWEDLKKDYETACLQSYFNVTNTMKSCDTALN
ncbi:MAG: hypothetical protein H0V39_00320, partial [Nitrosomonas sp.]|nr:hypothetical protein [Nitrosomonas sp.]